MPIDVVALEKYLRETMYDVEETNFLVEGFTLGFGIGYSGPVERSNYSKIFHLNLNTS